MHTRHVPRHGIKLFAILTAFFLLAAACSGSKPASELAREGSPSPEATVDEVAEGGDPADADASGEGSGTPGTSTGSGGGGDERSAATVSAPGEEPQVTQDEATGVPVANLFKPEEDRVGITDDEIKLCMHAAFVFGDVFNNKKSQEDVYWRKLNAEGGIYGRKVSIQFEDDAYNPNQAVQAAEACKQNDAFFILSGVGFDQIPQVRQWAEDNRQLYFYSMATEDGAQGKQFSFATAPTLQTMGKQIAQYLLAAHGSRDYAVLSRNSTNWDGALEGFKAELKRQGKAGKLTYEKKVDNGQDYNAELLQLRDACPASKCVVYANENVLNFVKLYQQAETQGYRPVWFNYGFQLTNDTIGESTADAPPVEAWYPTPAFDPLNETGQPWWGEIQAMKAAYDKYCTGACDKDSSEVNDVDWQFWVAFKSLHRLLLDCGQDCTRNKIAGLLLNGYKTKVDPLCEADFSRGNHHFGAWRANIYRSVKHSNGSVFKQIQTCKEGF